MTIIGCTQRSHQPRRCYTSTNPHLNPGHTAFIPFAALHPPKTSMELYEDLTNSKELPIHRIPDIAAVRCIDASDSHRGSKAGLADWPWAYLKDLLGLLLKHYWENLRAHMFHTWGTSALINNRAFPPWRIIDQLHPRCLLALRSHLWLSETENISSIGDCSPMLEGTGWLVLEQW